MYKNNNGMDVTEITTKFQTSMMIAENRKKQGEKLSETMHLNQNFQSFNNL